MEKSIVFYGITVNLKLELIDKRTEFGFQPELTIETKHAHLYAKEILKFNSENNAASAWDRAAALYRTMNEEYCKEWFIRNLLNKLNGSITIISEI